MPTLQKISIEYDALGRPVKTLNPDGSEQLIVYGKPKSLSDPSDFKPSPWEKYTYDANDNAGRTHATDSSSYSSHWNTPKSEQIDVLGRVIKTTEHNAHYNGSSYDDVILEYDYDIQGNLLEVNNNEHSTPTFLYQYDLAKKPLAVTHIDSGEKLTVYNAVGNPIEGSDAKGSFVLSTYDNLNRPLKSWAKNNLSDTNEATRLVVENLYGDDSSISSAKAKNLRGQLHKQWDEAGLLTHIEFDFKGNLLDKKRKVIELSELQGEIDSFNPWLVDWENKPPALEEDVEYQTSSTYDALNRVTLLTLPKDVDDKRNDITPSYNRAGALEKVDFAGTNYVEHIAYNAKGQRLMIALGNDMMTRYAYHPKTIRLTRQKTEKYIKTTSGTPTNYTYSPQSGTTKQDNGYEFDLIGNILKIKHRTTECGINGTTAGDDALDRLFTYDPLNRLLTATGRESDTQNQNDYLYTQAPTPGTPNANNVRAYTRSYEYDKLSNVGKVTQAGTNGFTRNFNYGGGVNTLDDIQDNSSNTIQDFTYDAVGNQLTAGTTRNMVWDHSDRMIAYYNKVGTNDPTIYAQYLYDSAGNRTHKVIRTGSGNYETTVYIDGVFEYHTKDEGGSTNTKNYTHIMDGQTKIASVRTGTPFNDDIAEDTFYILADQIGSGTERLKTNGTVIDKEEFYPFGDSSLRTFTKKRYRYTGKEKDQESGLYYYGARYYAAWTCRFISVDPLAHDYPYLTPYNNAGNKPINHFDIDGRQSDGDSPVNTEGEGSTNESEASQTNKSYEGAKNAENIKTGATYTYDTPVEGNELKGKPIEITKVEATSGGKGTHTAGKIDISQVEQKPVEAPTEPAIPNDITLNEDSVRFKQLMPEIDNARTNSAELNKTIKTISEQLKENPDLNIQIEGTTQGVWPNDPANPTSNESDSMNTAVERAKVVDKYTGKNEKFFSIDTSSGDSKTLGENRAAVIGNKIIKAGVNISRISISSSSLGSENTSRSVKIYFCTNEK